MPEPDYPDTEPLCLRTLFAGQEHLAPLLRSAHVFDRMDDFVGAQALKFWGDKNCMWSSDYPHGNMTWPNSRAFIAKQIGDLDYAIQERLISQNVIDLYRLEL